MQSRLPLCAQAYAWHGLPQPTSSMLRGAWRRKGRFPSTSVTVGADQFGPVWCKLRSRFSNGLQGGHRCTDAALAPQQG